MRNQERSALAEANAGVGMVRDEVKRIRMDRNKNQPELRRGSIATEFAEDTEDASVASVSLYSFLCGLGELCG